MLYTKNSTDQDLIKGCQRKDRLAQKYLYQKYYGKMMVICLRYSSNQDEAVDILNRAFLKVFNAIDDFEQTGSFSGWIARIVFNTAIDFVRANTHYQKVIDFNAEKDIEFPPDVLDQLIAEDLYKAIQQLPGEMRSVFSLYVLDGYKHREIAEMLQININTSKWQLANAKRELQKKLKNYPLVQSRKSGLNQKIV